VTASAETVRGTDEPLEYLNEAVAAAAALRAAVRLGMLYQLDVAAATTTKELAAACGIEGRGAERLLHALAGLGLVELYGDRWRRLLPELSGLARLVALWDNLEGAVREGSPMVRADTVDGAASFYPDVVGNLGTMLAAAARRTAFLLPAATHVLDAGAGAAPWSIAYAIRHTLAIADIVPDQGSASRSAGLYELGLHLRTGSGGVHRLKAYREWLAGAKFQPPEIHELVDDPPLRLIIARKAGGSR
jgi:hypothetical protein